MKYILPVLMIIVSVTFMFIISAQNTSADISFPPAFPPYKQMGGKVLSYIPFPAATCIGLGTLIITSGALLPVYAKNPLKFPIMGGQILAKISLIPSLSTCFSPTGIPIPIFLTTSNYGVSD